LGWLQWLGVVVAVEIYFSVSHGGTFVPKKFSEHLVKIIVILYLMWTTEGYAYCWRAIFSDIKDF